MEMLVQYEMNLSVPDVPALVELLNCHPKEVRTSTHMNFVHGPSYSGAKRKTRNLVEIKHFCSTFHLLSFNKNKLCFLSVFTNLRYTENNEQ